MSGPPPVLDLETARRLIPGGTSGLLKLASMTRGESRSQLAALREALAAKRADRVARAAHTLKGDMGYFGAEAAADAARTVETLAKAGDLAAVRAFLPALEEATQQVMDALAELAETLEADGGAP